MPNHEDGDLPLKQRLEAIQLEIQRLREENAQLLEASKAFGQLAERLNTQLQEERRLGEADRRRWSRLGSVARRGPSGNPATPVADPARRRRVD